MSRIPCGHWPEERRQDHLCTDGDSAAQGGWGRPESHIPDLNPGRPLCGAGSRPHGLCLPQGHPGQSLREAEAVATSVSWVGQSVGT